MLKRLLFIFIGVAISSCTTSVKRENISDPSITSSEISEERQIKIKALKSDAINNGLILDHKYFVISYNKDHRLANFVQYNLTKKNIQDGKFKRTDKFFTDPQLKAQGISAVSKKDYLKSGYDKGHLAPAEDFSWSRDSIDETFVMSNMTPQKGNLNQRAWKYLELRVRKWACGEEKIIVITGPILEKGLKKLNNSISIPKRFFKAVFDETSPKKTVCFIYNQADSTDVYKERAMSLSDCENEIGFQLFKEFSEREKTIFAKSYNLEDWTERNCE